MWIVYDYHRKLSNISPLSSSSAKILYLKEFSSFLAEAESMPNPNLASVFLFPLMQIMIIGSKSRRKHILLSSFPFLFIQKLSRVFESLIAFVSPSLVSETYLQLSCFVAGPFLSVRVTTTLNRAWFRNMSNKNLTLPMLHSYY